MTTKSKTIKRTAKPKTAAPAAKKLTDESGKLLGIAARIMTLSAAAEPAPSWREKVKRSMTGVEDDRVGILRAGQAMRDAGVDLAFAYMSICMGAEDIAADREKTDAELARISAAIRKREKESGLKEGEFWPRGKGPDDVKALNVAFEKRCRQIEADVLREYGEDEMADALLADEDAFDAKYREPGRLAHFGPLPEWAEKKRKGIPGQDK